MTWTVGSRGILPNFGDAVRSGDSVAGTLPGWRGKGIHPAVSRFINRYERSRGYTRDCFYVWAHNAANLKVVVGKLRRRRTKTLWYVWLFRRRQPWSLGWKGHGVPHLERVTTPSRSGTPIAQPTSDGAVRPDLPRGPESDCTFAI